MTYHEIVGMRVVDLDGRALGRVADLVAHPAQDDTIRINGLLIGSAALLNRIGRKRWGVKRWRLKRRGLWRIEAPWDMVAAIEARIIRLRCRRSDLTGER